MDDAVMALSWSFAKTTLLPTDDGFASAYIVGERLGSGGAAQVFEARRRGPGGAQASLAVKVMDKTLLLSGRAPAEATVELRRMRDECRVLAELSHPKVVLMHEILESPQCLYIVMERAMGGALFDRVIQTNGFSERQARRVMRQLVDVLAFMHSHGVIHRDIKPENILLKSPSSWDIKVSDFGLVKISPERASLAPSAEAGRLALSASVTARQAASSVGHQGGPGALDAVLAAICEATGSTATRPPANASPEDLVEWTLESIAAAQSFGGQGGAPASASASREHGISLSALTEGHLLQELTREASRHLVHCRSQVGSPYYRAPEQVHCTPPYPTTYGQGVDVWSAGVVLYVLLSARLPFDCALDEAAVPRPPLAPAYLRVAGPQAEVPMNAHPFPSEEFGAVSEGAKAAINAMMVVDPLHRPSAAEMLRHEWLRHEARDAPKSTRGRAVPSRRVLAVLS